MATRSDRLADFITERHPPPGTQVRSLCEDHNGTYLLRFPCMRADDVWKNATTGETLEATVVGWAPWVDVTRT